MKSDSLNKKVGENIQNFRKKSGYNRSLFAELIGVSRASLVNMENGRQSVSVPHLLTICALLKVGYEAVIGKPPVIEVIEVVKTEKKVRVLKTKVSYKLIIKNQLVGMTLEMYLKS